MKKRGTYLIPTLSVFDMMFDRSDVIKPYTSMGEANPDKLKVARKRRELRDQSFKYAYQIGVKMAFGTDHAVADAAPREFSYLDRLGVSPWDIVRMATINGADVLDMNEDLGSISVGKYADIIAVSENPIANITALEEVSFVMKNGEVILD